MYHPGMHLSSRERFQAIHFFTYPTEYYHLPPGILTDDEQLVKDGPAKFRLLDTGSSHSLMPGDISFREVEGVLALTNRRLVFSLMEKFISSPVENVLFDVPLMYIQTAPHSGFSYSVLTIKIDPSANTGVTQAEFYVQSSEEWAKTILRMMQLCAADLKPRPKRGGTEGSPGSGFEKVCLKCMSVVPEDARVCPKCGEKF
jgi:hypothetical protein